MTLRVDLIGAGHWGPNLAGHFNGLPGASLTTLCDLNADSLSGLGERSPRARRVQDYRLLLEAYNHVGYGEGSFPVAEVMCHEVLSHSMCPELTLEEVERVGEDLEHALGARR